MNRSWFDSCFWKVRFAFEAWRTVSRLKFWRSCCRRWLTPPSALTPALWAGEEGSDGSDGSSSSVVVVVAVAGSGSSSELLGVSGGNPMASWAGGEANCVVKASAGCTFGLVGTGSEGQAERRRVRDGAMVVSIVRFVCWVRDA